MTGNEKKSKGEWPNWLTFFVHIVIATLVWGVVAAALCGVLLFAQFLEARPAAAHISEVFTALEIFAFQVNAGVFVAFSVVSALHFIHHLVCPKWKPTWIVVHDKEHSGNWWKPGAMFAGNVIAANLILICIALAAYGVLLFTHILPQWNAPQEILTICLWVEEGLLWLDGIVYVVYVATMAYDFVLGITNVEWRPTGSALFKRLSER